MVLFMPQSPRHLMNRDREDECLATLARLRSTTTDDIRVRGSSGGAGSAA